jgi:hypothetical protein
MESKEVNKNSEKPFIIANSIYDTVFKRLMENQRIVKFFLSTIIKHPCVKIRRTHTDMLSKTKFEARSEFIENLIHDSYVIQAGPITRRKGEKNCRIGASSSG